MATFLNRAILAVTVVSLVAVNGKSAEQALLLGHIELGSAGSVGGPIRFSASEKEIFRECLRAP